MSQNRLDSPIFVTGIERSGSSIVAKIIHHCGGFTGGASEMYENFQVKKLLDFYYDSMGADRRGQWPLPSMERIKILPMWKNQIESVLLKESYHGMTPWMLKGSRICQTWPLWHATFPNAKWVIVRRRTGDIIDSCLKTGYMNAFQDKEGWLDWIHIHEKLFLNMVEAGINYREVWPERMASGDYEQMHQTLTWLGLPWSNDILVMVEPLLYRSKQRIRKES